MKATIHIVQWFPLQISIPGSLETLTINRTVTYRASIINDSYSYACWSYISLYDISIATSSLESFTNAEIQGYVYRTLWLMRQVKVSGSLQSGKHFLTSSSLECPRKPTLYHGAPVEYAEFLQLHPIDGDRVEKRMLDL